MTASILFPWVGGALVGIDLAAVIIAIDLYRRRRAEDSHANDGEAT